MRIISQELLTLIFNSLWQIALIAAVATLCARLLRAAKAGTRHLLWVAALVAPVCLAAVTFWIGARQGLFTLKPATNIELNEGVVLNGLPLNFSTDALPPLPAPSKSIPVSRTLALALLGGYGLLFAYRSIQLLRAWVKTRAIVRDANEAELPTHISEIIDRCLETIGTAKVRVLWSPSIAVPVTIGALRPVVILPEKMLEEKDEDLLTTALGHELAHIRRRDYALNFIYELLYVPISFHPAAAWVKRRIRQTREQRCDELVTEKLLNAGAYARSLVKMAGWAAPVVYSTPIISLGIADAGNLEERVMSILRKPRISTRKKSLSIAAASLLFAIPCIAAAPHIFGVSVKAQDVAAAPSRVAAPAVNYAPVTIATPQQEGDRQSEPAKNSQENQEYPRCIYCPRPEYAADAREQKIQGEVWLEATVKTDGKAYDIKVKKSLYPSLDKNAIESLKTWRFEPAVKDGKQIEKQTTIQVQFLLDPGAEDRAREKRELAMQDEKERGYADKTMQEKKEQELIKRQGQDRLEVLDHDRMMSAIKEQIHELEMARERAIGANDAEAEQRAEVELFQIHIKLFNQERETKIAMEKMAEDSNRQGYLPEGQNQSGKYVPYGPDGGQKQAAEFRQVQTELAARVKIPMSKAIEAATKDHPGTVVNCELRGSADNIFYAITIVHGEEQQRQSMTVLVSAIDGKVLAGRDK
jgi:TonB family protein